MIKKKGSKGICDIYFEGDPSSAFTISTSSSIELGTIPSEFLPTSFSNELVGYGYSNGQGKVFICRLVYPNRLTLIVPPAVGTLTIQNSERVYFKCSYSI